ncbi:MAG: TlpA family protein disulfide reductase, partial [Undibacterium sp.]|nr:TlpA family protein disulfide reductase [Undibacterium sp.]
FKTASGEVAKMELPTATVYKLVVDAATFEKAKQDKNKFTFSKMESDDLTQIVEMSEQEKAAFKTLSSKSKKVKIGDSFPAFTLENQEGKVLTEKLFQGKLTLINFYFDTCAPCIAETPALNRFAKNHPQIQTLAMTPDSAKQVQDYLAQHQFAWTTIGGGAQLIYNDIGLTSYPSFALVDAEGKIVALGSAADLELGDKVEHNLVAWIDQLTEGKAWLPQKSAPQ